MTALMVCSYNCNYNCNKKRIVKITVFTVNYNCNYKFTMYL